MSTRGASAWVRNTPTGLPDWTSSVSSPSRRRKRRDDAVERLPVARRPPDAAIDDELARPFGDVGVEIVHEHAQRRFGQPALGAELGSAGAADDAHIVDAGWRGHGLSLYLSFGGRTVVGSESAGRRIPVASSVE